MNAKPIRLKCSMAALAATTLATLPALSQIPMATEPFSRAGKSEIYGIGQYLHSDDIVHAGPRGDVNIRMDDTGLGGFGMAYHFSDYISIRGEFMFGSATFHANLPLQTGGTLPATDDALLQTGRLNLDYNIINRRLTPFVTAGIGYQYIETELQRANPIYGWWWDPWYGWVPVSTQPTAWQTDFTWNAGAGLRWNITDSLFVKAMGGANWLEYSGARSVTMQIEAMFAVGFSF